MLSLPLVPTLPLVAAADEPVLMTASETLLLFGEVVIEDVGVFVPATTGRGLMRPLAETVVGMPAEPTASGDSLGTAGTRASNLGSFSTAINPGPTLSLPENAHALAAFNRAAQQWEARISDPITVNIDADLAPLGEGIIGSTYSVLLQDDYTVVRDKMVADAADEFDDGIVAHLPTFEQFQAVMIEGFGLDGQIVATKANFKALGYEGLDDQFETRDASITFSTNFSFDYDNSDGVSPGKMDFETVAAHEIGHALGFVSRTDWMDYLVSEEQVEDIGVGTLDMFRFADGQIGRDPSNPSEFTTFPRLLAPGVSAIFDQISPADGSAAESGMSEGRFNGDGRQASHWKDNDLSGLLIGMMDPTLSYGQMFPLTDSDLRSLDLIGYEITVPEPATISLLAAVGVMVLIRRGFPILLPNAGADRL